VFVVCPFFTGIQTCVVFEDVSILQMKNYDYLELQIVMTEIETVKINVLILYT